MNRIQDSCLVESMQLALSFRSNLNQIREIIGLIKGHLQRMIPLSVEQDFNIHVSLTEALSNAIIHGNKENSTKKVDLTMRVSQKRIEFIVEDEGEGFDYQHLPDPTEEENLWKPHGRGILFMKTLMHKVEYNSRGNQLMLGYILP